MTKDEILAQFRRKLGEALVTLGDASPIYTDAYLLDYLAGAALELEVFNLGDEPYDVDPTTETITPDPSTTDGVLLVLCALSNLLMGELVAKVGSGELGVRFKTGLDELSTTEASKKLADVGKDAQKEYLRLKTYKLSTGSDYVSRVQ